MTNDQKALNKLADWMLDNNFVFRINNNSFSICKKNKLDAVAIIPVNSFAEITSMEVREAIGDDYEHGR